MKANLLLNNPGGQLSGYVNIDGAASEDECRKTGRISGSVTNLEHTIDANELDELNAIGILDRYTLSEADAILDHWISRLKHGGSLVLSVTDIRQVSRDVSNSFSSLADINHLLYGNEKRSVYSMGDLVQTLESRGLHILKKVATNYRVTIVARRP